MRDAWRLAVGTLTAIPIKSPVRTDRQVAAVALVLAPVAVVPLAAVAAATLLIGRGLDAPPLLTGFVAVGAVAWGSRGIHLDGLSDTTDALAASYDRDRSLAVMKSGSSGPAGTASVVVALGVQAAALSELATAPRGWLVAAVLVCLSRAALTITCTRGVPPARPVGMGATFAGCVPMRSAVVSSAVVVALTLGALVSAGAPWWTGALTALVALLVTAAVTKTAVRRFGGVTGDVYGAAVEISLMVLLCGAVLAV